MSAVTPLLDPRLRPMRDDDLDQVLEIERDSFSTPWSRNTFQNLLRRRDTDLWVATAGDAVVGYAVTWYVVDEAELGNLTVMADWRGRGIGRLLLESALASAATRGAGRIFLEVRPSNEAARHLYESRGFTVVGMRRRYYRAPVEDALVMRMELGGEGA